MSTLTMSNLITQYLQQNAEEEVREQKYFNIFFYNIYFSVTVEHLFLFLSDPRSCKRSFHSGVILSLTLLSLSMVVALIILGVYCESGSTST